MHAILRLIRPVNSLMMGFAVIVGYTIASKGAFLAPLTSLILGFLTGFLLTSASMILNDYFDMEIDAINDPSRPIPSGQISPREAIYLAMVLTTAGIISAMLINMLCFIIALFSWIISTVYNGKFKRTGFIGNLMVSLCVAIPFIFGAAITNNIPLSVFIFFIMVFLSNTGREVVKGIVDVPGDKSKGVMTVAVKYGEDKAAFLALILFLIAVMISPIPWLWKYISDLYLILVLIADAGFIFSSFKLVRNPKRTTALAVKRETLLWMFIGLLAFLTGSMY